MHRMVIQLEEDLYQVVRERAHALGSSMAALVRTTLARGFGLRRRGRVHRRVSKSHLPRFVGIGRSGKKDIAEKHDQYLGQVRK